MEGAACTSELGAPALPAAAQFGQGFAAGRTNRIQNLLHHPLPRNQVDTRANGAGGGGKVLYVAAHNIYNLANNIFGVDGWSSEITQMIPEFCTKDERGRYTAACTAVVRVTLRDGTYHEDIGTGVSEGARSKAEAIRKSKKDSVTDARKRVLRIFGNGLGNCTRDPGYQAWVAKGPGAGQEFNTDDGGLDPRKRFAAIQAHEEVAAPQRMAQARHEQQQRQQREQQQQPSASSGADGGADGALNDRTNGGAPPNHRQQGQQQQQQRRPAPSSSTSRGGGTSSTSAAAAPPAKRPCNSGLQIPAAAASGAGTGAAAAAAAARREGLDQAAGASASKFDDDGVNWDSIAAAVDIPAGSAGSADGSAASAADTTDTTGST